MTKKISVHNFGKMSKKPVDEGSNRGLTARQHEAFYNMERINRDLIEKVKELEKENKRMSFGAGLQSLQLAAIQALIHIQAAAAYAYRSPAAMVEGIKHWLQEFEGAVAKMNEYLAPETIESYEYLADFVSIATKICEAAYNAISEDSDGGQGLRDIIIEYNLDNAFPKIAQILADEQAREQERLEAMLADMAQLSRQDEAERIRRELEAERRAASIPSKTKELQRQRDAAIAELKLARANRPKGSDASKMTIREYYETQCETLLAVNMLPPDKKAIYDYIKDKAESTINSWDF